MKCPKIFNIYKPKGVGSFDVVRNFKRLTKKKYSKIGHFGTLDPFACGVLLVGVDGASRLNDFVHQYLPKTYVAEGILGQRTDSGDTTGKVVANDQSEFFLDHVSSLDKARISSQLSEKFLGKYWQVPPAFSATKHQGKPLYAYAKEGIHILKSAVEREIISLEILSFQFPKILFKATVGSGTYIRTLFEDMAQDLGTVGVLDQLERTNIGFIDACNGKNLENWDGVVEEKSWVYGPEQLLPFKKIQLGLSEAKKFGHGAAIAMDLDEQNEFFWVQNEEQHLLGLGQKIAGKLTTKINFSTSN